MYDLYLKEVQSALDKLTSHKRPSKFLPESYIGSEYQYYRFLNVRVPKIREQMKKGFSFSTFAINDQWKIWDYIWQHSDTFEVTLLAAHFANKRPVEELFFHRKKLVKWIGRIDNWALSDELSNIMAKLIEYKASEFYPYYQRWNVSKNPWERRLSMVGLLYYKQLRKKYLPYNKIIKMVKPHLQDPHYYVQKAVGWTLRECWNVYPKQTYEYLVQNAHLIPAGGWTAATEKLSKSDKERLKKLRKAYSSLGATNSL
jgi:3-methyladenine DNA glycosylase AlkD